MNSMITNANKQASPKKVSSLLRNSIPENTLMLMKQGGGPTKAQSDEIKYFQDMLVKLGHTSIFDITRISRSRFLYRYDKQLLGRAGEIYDRAASFTTQVIQKFRRDKNKSNKKYAGNTRGATNVSGKDLPCYADLFPESWLDFCRSGDVQAVDSPVSYLVDLYRFVQEIEADSKSDAITLDKRRPDIAQLSLNYDTTYQELPELELVNAILMLSIQNFLNITDESFDGANADPAYVYSVLDSTRFPFSLPYSFPNDKVHTGLALKDCTLSQLVQTKGADKFLPWEMTQVQRDNILLAASKLSLNERTLLTENPIFSQYLVTAKQLEDGYLTGSTTEILPDTNLDQHGYLVLSGSPNTLEVYSALMPDCPDHFDEITLTCSNAGNATSYTITLKGESVLTYHRVKARMVEFEASDDDSNKRAYSRQLRLSCNDIPDDLSDGPYFGSLDVDAQTFDKENFAQLRFAFSLADEGIPTADLWTGSVDYFLDNYGIKTKAEYSDLKQITEFARSVNGTVVEVEQILAQGDYRPKVSSNIVFENTIFSEGQSTLTFPDTYHYGAKYINNARPSPLSIKIKRGPNNSGWREISNTSPAHYERINRFLRLARWSALPHDKLDLLLNSVMKAEVGSIGDITPQTIKAYGLYCYLHERYSMTAEEFSTMFGNINVYSISPEVPFFDRIFNNHQLFDEPFVQDTTAFVYTNPLDANVKQICSGLGISATTFLLLAPLVQVAFNIAPTKLNRTAPVLSALYRLVKLPTLFGLPVEEGLDLLKILSKVLELNLSDGGSVEEEYQAFVTRFVIQPRIENAEWDTTGIILQIEQLVEFMRESGFNTSDLLFLLEVTAAPLVSTQGMADFFRSIQNQLTGGVLLSEESFQRPDLPDLPLKIMHHVYNASSWMDILAGLITPEGLVRPYPEVWGQTDAEYLKQQLETIAAGINNFAFDADDTVAVLEQIISQAKSAQDNVVATAVSNEYGVSRELVNPLLSWCNSSVMDICTVLLKSKPIALPLDSGLFNFAYDVLLHVSVMSKLKLSAIALFMRLAQPEWLNLGVGAVPAGKITLEELWILNDYVKLLKGSSYSEQEIQDYFATANIHGNNDGLKAFDYSTLMANILAWDVEEVLNATAGFKDVTPARAINMLQINWLSQIQQLSAQTGMPADEVISASELGVDADVRVWIPIGQNVVAAFKEDSESLGEHLASSLRDALVGYYLDQLVPNNEDMAPYRDWLKTIDTLYDFLLLDTQVSYKVKTAGVAQATKSLQQYINRITLNLEPGLKTTLEETLNWREFANRYGNWAGNQQLKIYPEVYIDPTLRLGKTDLFFQLESVLNQGKLGEETVESAVLGYLNAFEEVSNLEVLSGYESGIEIGKDKIYLVAKTRAQPNLYYWRSLDMTQGDDSNLELYPNAWGEWKHIDLPLDAAVPRTVRPVILNSRLYVTWIEVSKEEKDTTSETTKTSFITKLMLAHLKFNGAWSTPNLLKEDNLDYELTDLIAVLDTTRAEEKLMLVGYMSKIGLEAEKLYDYTVCFSYSCDTMLIESTDFPPSPNPNFSDIDYYSDKLIWFYTREPGNLYFDGDPLPGGGNYVPGSYPVYDSSDEAWSRKKIARKLILYPYVNTTEWPIEDTYSIIGTQTYPVSNGSSGKYGAADIKVLSAFTADNINRLSVTAQAPTYKYFEDKSVPQIDKLTVVLFCIWVWKRSPEGGNDITTGTLLYRDYKAYYNPKEEAVEGAQPYPNDGITLDAVIDLEPGWGDIVVQAGFSLVKVGENWKPGDNYYTEDNGGRFTATYTVGKKLRQLVQNRVNDKVASLQFPQCYAHNDNDAAIRLNTLFAKELISRATKGTKYVLAWETQNLNEPPLTPNSHDIPINFNGANGIYFWELFFHMPYLIAWRLNIEQRYEEAAEWAHYIFNPYESLDQSDLAEGKPRFWNSRPVSPLEDDNGLNRALTQPADPDAIAESDPVHYRKAVFRFYVDNLIDQGDKEYRKQDSSSRTVARLSYDSAASLLGQSPDVQMATTWDTCILKDAANYNESDQRKMEMGIKSLKALPVTYDDTISNQDNGLFLDPFNSKLTELWDTLDQRLYNLRHNLTIDGKEILAPLYEIPVDPMALQSQRYQRVVALKNAGAAKFVVPNYRFTPMLAKAMSGVETLIQFGSTLLSLLERKDGLNFESFQMNQHLAMYNYTISLQKQSIEISKMELEASQASREIADQRYQHYKKLYDEDISSTEHEVIQLQASAASSLIASQGTRTAAAALDMAPNMFGLASGGMNWGAPLNAMAEANSISYHSDSTKADSLSVSESYRRRRQEWQIQYQQAELEVAAIDKQIEVQQRQVNAGQTQLKQIEMEYEQSQELFEYFRRRFTNENLYIWMTSRLSDLYLQAYDAVMSLCLTAEAAWQYEIGQFSSQFVQPGVWNDLYQGLLVGETMKLGLIRMDQAYTYQNIRCQEIIKTISLKDHMGMEAFERGKSAGKFEFDFILRNFSNDFIGLKNQRIESVAISLPTLVGPYQDINATLTQISSLINGSVGTERKQVILSHGVKDNGMFTFNDDGRFLPFEGSGIESSWSLVFTMITEEQKKIVANLTDVIFHMNYTAVTV